MLGLIGCNQRDELQQGDNNMQYFFAAKVIEVHEEYLLLEVIDIGNTNLSEGIEVEVSTDVVSTDGCPEFVASEYAKVLVARNTDDSPTSRIEALSIYKTDETGRVITNDNETVLFHNKIINKSDLSADTLEWLEWHNALSLEEKSAISSIPNDLYELCGYDNAEEIEAPTE